MGKTIDLACAQKRTSGRRENGLSRTSITAMDPVERRAVRRWRRRIIPDYE